MDRITHAELDRMIQTLSGLLGTPLSRQIHAGMGVYVYDEEARSSISPTLTNRELFAWLRGAIDGVWLQRRTVESDFSCDWDWLMTDLYEKQLLESAGA